MTNRPEITEPYIPLQDAEMHHAYSAYFESFSPVTPFDIATLQTSGHQLQASRTPFTAVLRGLAHQLESAYYDREDNPQAFNDLQEKAVKAGLQAYVYSGQRVNPLFIEAVLARFGLEPKALADVIEPTPARIIDSNFGALEAERAQQIRVGAYAVMKQLGISPSKKRPWYTYLSGGSGSINI